MHPNLGPGPYDTTVDEERTIHALSDRYDEIVDELLAENGPGSDAFCIRRAHEIVYGYPYPWPLDESVRVHPVTPTDPVNAAAPTRTTTPPHVAGGAASYPKDRAA